MMQGVAVGSSAEFALIDFAVGSIGRIVVGLSGIFGRPAHLASTAELITPHTPVPGATCRPEMSHPDDAMR